MQTVADDMTSAVVGDERAVAGRRVTEITSVNGYDSIKGFKLSEIGGRYENHPKQLEA